MNDHRYPPSPVEAAREQHHRRLISSVNDLDEITAQLQSLLMKIQNDDNSSDKTTNQLQPVSGPHSLASVLKSAPDRIREVKSQQLDIISAINEALF
jgi:hypothetical protein